MSEKKGLWQEAIKTEAARIRAAAQKEAEAAARAAHDAAIRRGEDAVAEMRQRHEAAYTEGGARPWRVRHCWSQHMSGGMGGTGGDTTVLVIASSKEEAIQKSGFRHRHGEWNYSGEITAVPAE